MRRKRHLKSHKKYIILPAIFLLFLFSVGYSAFSSEFLISGKGTIIEKGTISIGGVNVKTVTTGSGLYASEYEEGRYIYRGASPDNYLTLVSDSYRIISKEADGTLKVIKSEKVGNMAFDPGYSTSITGVTSSSSTEGTRYSSNSSDYCYASNASEYYGCKVWGSKTTMLDSFGNNVTTMPWVIGSTEYNLPDSEAYINTYLNTTWYNSLTSSIQNIITTHLFNVGLVAYTETNLATTLSTEKAYKWSGKVGLANVSDYVLATTNENCSSVNDHSWKNDGTCYSTNSTDNWLYKDIMINAYYPWLSAPISTSYSYDVWFVYSEDGDLDYYRARSSDGAVPVLYLKSDIKLSGTGKLNDQFTLIN